MIKASVGTLLCLLFIFPTGAWGQVDPLLDNALTKLKPASELDVTLLDGDRYLGVFAGRRDDQLWLSGAFGPGDLQSTVSLPLAEIARLQVESSGAGRGFAAGFTTGAVVGGSFSLLMGLALSTFDSQDDHTMGVIGFTLVGTMAGGVGLGVVGAGIGALARIWHTVYEAPLAAPPRNPSRPQNTRVALGAGVASGYQDASNYQDTGFYGTAGLQKPLGPLVAIGPELGFYNLGGVLTRDTGDYTYQESISPVVSIGLAATWQPRRAGWAPFLVSGTGYYISEGEYLGLSLGGGLRYRAAGQQEVKIEIRDHFSIYDDGHNFMLDHFLTLGANFSFGL